MTSTTAPKVIEYATAVDRGLKIMARHGKDSWQLGDIAANVETKYGKDTHQNLARDIGINYKTLINYRTVARAYAPAERSKVNSFRVHEIFAGLDNRAALVAEKEWTAAEAQAKLAEVKAGQTPPVESAETRLSKAETKVAKLRAALAEAEADRDAIKAEVEASKPKTSRNRKNAPAPAPANVVPIAQHISKGVPAHSPEDCTAACPQYKNETARRTNHARQTA